MSDDFFRVVGNLKTLRATLKPVSTEQIREFVHKLTVIIDERDRDEEAMRLAHQERLKKVDLIRQQMEHLGINPQELLSDEEQKSFIETKPKKIKTRTNEPKYEYIDELGQYRTWTGQGRTPRRINNEISHNGKTLQDFLIKK